MQSGNFKQSFSEQLNLTDSNAVRLWYAVVLAALVALPFVASPYLTGFFTTVLFTLVGVLGLNVLTGFTGLVSLGHVAFLVLGGYAYAITTVRFGLHPLLAFGLAGVVPAVAGLVVGIPSLRLKGLYLAITTLAFTFIVYSLILAGGDFTGSGRGLMVPRPVIFGIDFSSERALYWLCLALTLATLLGVLNIRRSRLGRAFMAIRDNDQAAVAMGISLTKYKLLAFVISSFLTGISGALMVLFINFANVEGFPFLLSIEAVAILIVGGIGSVLGTVIGTIFIISLPEVSTQLLGAVSAAFGWQLNSVALEIKGILYGCAIVGFLMLDPRGLVGLWIDLKRLWTSRPMRY
ncbi:MULTISPECIES: branched-chain amino acid ABC transporter permease [Polaromonas]|uniref:Branched-chain amino acid ABC transporter permease n=1 Tax=Polaromonas aquatica TaxID=332657 RepID=A0ABW1U6J2_9BURK